MKLTSLGETRSKETESFNFHKPTHLTHLQLKDPPFLLHLLCDLCAGDLCTDHAVLLGMFPLLLLNLCATTKRQETEDDRETTSLNSVRGYRKWLFD